MKIKSIDNHAFAVEREKFIAAYDHFRTVLYPPGTEEVVLVANALIAMQPGVIIWEEEETK